MYYKKLARTIYTVYGTLGCVCLRWRTDGEVGYSQRQCPCTVEQGTLSAGEWFVMEPSKNSTKLCKRPEKKICDCAIARKDFMAIAAFLSEQML